MCKETVEMDSNPFAKTTWLDCWPVLAVTNMAGTQEKHSLARRNSV